MNKKQTWKHQISDPRRQHAVKVREWVEEKVSDYFKKEGFTKVRTPLLVTSPGMEPYIRPMQVQPYFRGGVQKPVFLPTSPEFAMKCLLSGGLEKIFQITPAFRDEPRSELHLPEFTLLEWYRVGVECEAIMEDVENLLNSLIANREEPLAFQGVPIQTQTPWPRFRVRDLFLEYAGFDLVDALGVSEIQKQCARLGLKEVSNTSQYSQTKYSWDDYFYLIWLNQIEPRLPKDQAFFVTDYPPQQAALSVIQKDQDGHSWARRFEVFMGGMELANAFQELTDPNEQVERFKKDMDLRKTQFGEQFPASPVDPHFIRALAEGLPPSSGIALGIDRLIMLFADEPDIEKTFWMAPDWHCSF